MVYVHWYHCQRSVISFRLIIGAFSAKIGLMLGNYYYFVGVAGQVMALGAGICISLIPYF
jgi:hypothetical protein